MQLTLPTTTWMNNGWQSLVWYSQQQLGWTMDDNHLVWYSQQVTLPTTTWMNNGWQSLSVILSTSDTPNNLGDNGWQSLSVILSTKWHSQQFRWQWMTLVNSLDDNCSIKLNWHTQSTTWMTIWTNGFSQLAMGEKDTFNRAIRTKTRCSNWPWENKGTSIGH
jgi:hypothetical protein